MRLTYISCYNNENPNGEVTRILAQAQQNNERNGITGALVFNHNYFLQSIEGARPVINELIPSDENKGLALKFSTGTQFNPYLMSTNQIMMLIDTLSELQEQEEKDASAKKKFWFAVG